MASYSYNILGTYSDSDPTFEIIDNDPGTGVLTDGQAGTVFSANETLTNSGADGIAESIFLGTVVVGDVTILFTTALGEYYVWAHVDDPGTYRFPESLLQSLLSSANFTTCFLPGVGIATPTGRVPVEALAIGDTILAADGRAVVVKWMGRQSVVTAFGPPESAWPVRIAVGALGENRPTADLRVTSDHALVVDGLLVQAGALVNGSSIRRLTAAELGERYVVHHIETEGHEIILADGVPVETFIDTVSRRRFDNYEEYVALYGPAAPSIAEIELPRVKSARQLPRAVRDRLRHQALSLGIREGAAA